MLILNVVFVLFLVTTCLVVQTHQEEPSVNIKTAGDPNTDSVYQDQPGRRLNANGNKKKFQEFQEEDGEELEQIIRERYHLSEEEFLELRVKHDMDYDGELTGKEAYKAALELELEKRKKQEEQRTKATENVRSKFKTWLLLLIFGPLAVIVVYKLWQGDSAHSRGYTLGHGRSLQSEQPVAAVSERIKAGKDLRQRRNVTQKSNKSDLNAKEVTNHQEASLSHDQGHRGTSTRSVKHCVEDRGQGHTAEGKGQGHNKINKNDQKGNESLMDGKENRLLSDKMTLQSQRENSSRTDKLEDTSVGGETRSINKSSPIPNVQKKPEKSIYAGMSTEDQLVMLLSRIFNVQVDLQKENQPRTNKWSANSFVIKVSDLPTSGQLEKTRILYERRLAREMVNKMRFCISCYSHCISSTDPELDQACVDCLAQIKQMAISGILEQLAADANSVVDEDEDDFWNEIAGAAGSGDADSELLSFLARISGWTTDGVNVSAGLLNDILDQAMSDEKHQTVIVKLVKAAGKQIKNYKRLNELQMNHGKTKRGLEILLQQAGMVDLVAKQLEKEVDAAETSLGIYFEQESIFGPLLSLTTIPDSFVEGADVGSESSAAWTSLRGFPFSISPDELHHTESQVQESMKRLQAAVFGLLKRVMKRHKDTGLSWLATVVSMNEMRIMVAGQVDLRNSNTEAACSHGYMVNLCSVLLDFCMPFCSTDITKMSKVETSYAQSMACRLNYDFETCLAGGQIVSSDVTQHRVTGQIPEQLQGQFNFITEIFHITHRALNVGFHPAFRHFTKLQQALMQQMAALKDTQQGQDIKRRHLLVTLKWDCCLMEQELMRKGTEFYLATASWLLKLMKTGNQDEEEQQKLQKKILAQLPEFMVKDMARWFTFLTSHALRIHPRALAGVQMVPFVDCCVMLLERPDLMPGPIPATRICEALLAFVQSSDSRTKHQRGWGSGLTSDLAAMVHLCPSVQNHLGPALLRSYVSVDVVEGLDVDKEDFDKYGARAVIGSLLEHLWSRQDCRSSMLSLTGEKIFQSFLEATLNTLLYQLHDSLSRIASVKTMQRAQEDEASWQALSFMEREEKKRFLMNQEKTAEGFMKMSKKTLGLIDLFSMSAEVAKCFTRPGLASRAASAFLGFLESLCGPKASELKVKDMEKYSFKPKTLLNIIIGVLLRIAKEDPGSTDGFVCSMAGDRDLSMDTIKKTLTILETRGVASQQTVEEFTQFVEELGLMQLAMQTTEQEVGSEHAWQGEEDRLELDQAGLEELYVKKMELLRFSSAELEDSHSFLANATQQSVPGPALVKALRKEMKQWMESLPVHPHASVFVVQDEDRIDLVRALVTGPEGTPYSLGCFAFDIYFPSNYPNIPPLIKFLTTGNGKRMNPNLYADGKVCLSLLGTWHGGDASQKWIPSSSTLYQVLVSVQSMILIKDPMYNEPGYDGMRGTTEGEAESRKYNANLHLLTVRHAMLDQLRNPPRGLKSIIRKHFRLQKDAVLKQCSDWLRQCLDREQEKRLRQEVMLLREELIRLTQEPEDEEYEDEMEGEEDVE